MRPRRQLNTCVPVAQLSEPIIKITGSDGVRFNVDRAKARYFVLTAELGSYPHALQFWSLGQGGMQRRLGGAAAAASRAAESDGEHFSYEKDDRVTRTAVRSRFVGVSEEAHHRGKLVSFALTAEALLEARQATIGGADTAIESDEDTEASPSGWLSARPLPSPPPPPPRKLVRRGI